MRRLCFIASFVLLIITPGFAATNRYFSSHYATLHAAMAAAGTHDHAVLEIDGPVVLTGNVTVPANIAFVLGDGGLVTCGAYALTLHGHFEAPIRQVFDKTAKIVFAGGSPSRALPEWWGARGDGTTDDRIALQSAINSLSPGMTLFFARRTYLVSAGLVIEAKRNITLMGSSSGSGGLQNDGTTVIAYAGNGNESDVLMTARPGIAGNTGNNIIENLQFRGNARDSRDPAHRTGKGLYLHANPRYPGVVTHFTFRNCEWAYFVVGVQVGDDSTNQSNNEDHEFYGCSFYFNTTGYRQLWPNALNIDFYHVTALLNTKAFEFGSAKAQTGSCSIFGGDIAHNTTDYHVNGSVKLTVSNVRSEASKRILDAATIGGTAMEPITFSDCMFLLNKGYADTTYNFKIFTNTYFLNCKLGEYTGDVPVRFHYPNGSVTASLVNCKINNTAFVTDFHKVGVGARMTLVGCAAWSSESAAFVYIADRSTTTDNGSGSPPYTIANGDTAPSVLSSNFLRTSNAAPTRIIAFRDATPFQEITVITGDGNTTFVNGAAMKLKSAANTTPPAGSVIKFVTIGAGIWYEVSRSY